jgi:hypothetical protein
MEQAQARALRDAILDQAAVDEFNRLADIYNDVLDDCSIG